MNHLSPDTRTLPESTKVPAAYDIIAGRVLREWRLSLHLTQQAVADRIGVTFQQVQKYERGTNRLSLSRLSALAEVLGTTPTAFVARVDELAGIDGGSDAPPTLTSGQFRAALALVKGGVNLSTLAGAMCPGTEEMGEAVDA